MCYSCIESKFIREIALEYTTTKGGPQPAIGRDYRAWRVELSKTVKFPEEITLDTGIRAYNTQTTKTGKYCPWECESYTLRNRSCEEICEERQEKGELCPIKEAGLEHNCVERMEFETHEALELHNTKTGKWNQPTLDGKIAGSQGVYAIANRVHITQQEESQIMQAQQEDYNEDDDSDDGEY